MKRGSRIDWLPLVASVLTLGMLVLYLMLIRQQGGGPAAWAVVVLLMAAGAAGYGAVVGAPRRRGALFVAGGLLLVLGLLAILTIGLPILAIGGLCLYAAGDIGTRKQPRRRYSPQ